MKLTFMHIGEVCKYDQGEDRCRYLVCGRDGLRCAKHDDSLVEYLDDRARSKRMAAQGDNCGGHESDIKPAGGVAHVLGNQAGD